MSVTEPSGSLACVQFASPGARSPGAFAEGVDCGRCVAMLLPAASALVPAENSASAPRRSSLFCSSVHCVQPQRAVIMRYSCILILYGIRIRSQSAADAHKIFEGFFVQVSSYCKRFM